MKIYLDTNIILDWFRNMMLKSRKIEAFRIPKKLEFLASHDLNPILSELTRIEIARYLKADWNATHEEIDKLWNDFIDIFKIKVVETRKIDPEELTKICMEIPTRKKTLVNLLHLGIAKEHDCLFLTGEKDLLAKYKKYYKNTLSYTELRKRLSISS